MYRYYAMIHWRNAVSRIWQCIVVGHPDAGYQVETDESAERPPQCQIDGEAYAARTYIKATPVAIAGAQAGAKTGFALMFPPEGRYSADAELTARRTFIGL